jgi:hypothetical protein
MAFSEAARYGELKEFIVWKSNIVNLEETGTRVATRQAKVRVRQAKVRVRQARNQTDELENQLRR